MASFRIEIGLKSFRFENGPNLEWGDLEWEVNSGELHIVTGSNGSGKSTFLKVLCGVYPAFRQSNAAIVGHCTCQKQGRSTTIRPTIAGIPPASPLNITAGYASQAPAANLVTPMEALRSSTVERELAFPLEHVCLDRKSLRSRLEWGKARLEERGVSFLTSPSRLSKGQQQLVAVVSLIAAGPDLLVLDEPTSFLDGESLQWLANLILNGIDQGKLGACVLSTQDKRLLALLNGRAYTHSLPSPDHSLAKVMPMIEDLISSISLLPHFEPRPFALESFRVRTTETEFAFGDLFLSPGEHAVILGNNGSGKSTLCDTLTGYRRERISGRLSVGEWSQHLGFRKFAVPPHVAYAFQNAEDQITHADLARELLKPLKAESWRAMASDVLSYIVRGGNVNPWKLSYGQRKLLVMLTLCFSSSVLLLDEPFSSLDDKSKDILLGLLDDYLQYGGYSAPQN